jgi:hypothetical protein
MEVYNAYCIFYSRMLRSSKFYLHIKAQTTNAMDPLPCAVPVMNVVAF